MNDVLREQIQLNTKEVVVNVDNDHMKASIVLNGIGSDEAYTYEEIADKLSQAGVRTGINEARIREVILNKLYDIEIVVFMPDTLSSISFPIFSIVRAISLAILLSSFVSLSRPSRLIPVSKLIFLSSSLI